MTKAPLGVTERHAEIGRQEYQGLRGICFDHYTTKVAAFPFSSQVTSPTVTIPPSHIPAYGLSREWVESCTAEPAQNGCARSMQPCRLGTCNNRRPNAKPFSLTHTRTLSPLRVLVRMTRTQSPCVPYPCIHLLRNKHVPDADDPAVEVVMRTEPTARPVHMTPGGDGLSTHHRIN